MTQYCPYDIIADPAEFGLKRLEVNSQYGVQVVYVSETRSSDVVDLYLHGVGGSWSSWTPYFQAMQDRGYPLGNVLVPDLPGFGESANVARSLGAAEVGNYLLTLASDFGWKSVRLIGHSMGGFLALDMSSRSNAMICEVCVIAGAYYSIIEAVNSPGRSLLSGSTTAYLFAGMKVLAYLGPVGSRIIYTITSHGWIKQFMFGLFVHPGIIQSRIFRSVLANLQPVSFNLAAANGVGYDAGRQWASISVPIKAVFARKDHLVPLRDYETFKANHPKAATILVEDAGHFINMERPQVLADFFHDARWRVN